MTCFADGLQIVVLVRSTFALGMDVIYLSGNAYLPGLQTGLAKPRVTLEDALAGAVPLGPIASLVPASSPRIGEGAYVAVGLVRCTVARSISDELPAPVVPAWSSRGYGHRSLQRKSPASVRYRALVAAMTCIEMDSKPCTVCMSSVFMRLPPCRGSSALRPHWPVPELQCPPCDMSAHDSAR